MKKFPNLHFFGKYFSRLALFWQKFAILGEKLQILGDKSIKIGIFGVKSFPPLIFFPPLILFGRIFTYGLHSLPLIFSDLPQISKFCMKSEDITINI